MLKKELLDMEIRLARASSLIDVENSGDAGVVTGLPDAVTERVSVLPLAPTSHRNSSHNLHFRYSVLLCYRRTESIRYANIHFQWRWHISQPVLDSTYARGCAVPTQLRVAKRLHRTRHAGKGSTWISHSRIS